MAMSPAPTAVAADSKVALWDNVALLTLFDAINEVSCVSGNLHIQKTVFLAELAGINQSLRASHFRYFRFNQGPYSAQLAEQVKALEASGAITHLRTLTGRGRYILDYAAESIARSSRASEAQAIFRNVGREHGPKTGAALRDYVYSLTVPVFDFGQRPMLVAEIPRCTDILDPVSDSRLAEVSPFDDDTAEELAAELQMPLSALDPNDKRFKQTITEALSRAQNACS